MRAIGLMSGTSLDGVDAAWLDTDGVAVAETGPSLTREYPPALRRALRDLLDRAPGLEPTDPAVSVPARELTLHHAAAVAELARGMDQPAELIGFHGQTILHRPDRGRTWQIGDAALLARRTGLPVAYDFRGADVAAGGQGAPLAPAYHAALAGPLAKPLAVLNLGGVGNLTWIGADGALHACDTGPGNALLDDWAQRHLGAPMDRDGALALSGRPDRAVLERIMALPFFARPGPKSLDRLDFAVVPPLLAHLSPADGAATLAAFTALAVAAAPLPSPPRCWLVCGGGRRNPAIMAALRAALPAPVRPVETAGWDGDGLEAQCFAFLAVRCIRGLPLSFPGTTGVREPCPGGRVAMPQPAPPGRASAYPS